MGSKPFAIQPRKSESERNCPHQKPNTTTLSTSCTMRSFLCPRNRMLMSTPIIKTKTTAIVRPQPMLGFCKTVVLFAAAHCIASVCCTLAMSALLEKVAPVTASTGIVEASVMRLPIHCGANWLKACSKKLAVSALSAAAISLTVPCESTYI